MIDELKKALNEATELVTPGIYRLELTKAQRDWLFLLVEEEAKSQGPLATTVRVEGGGGPGSATIADAAKR